MEQPDMFLTEDDLEEANKHGAIVGLVIGTIAGFAGGIAFQYFEIWKLMAF